ncbi:hypothetical protein [Burkholderia gladioli]|uniref:SLAC1 family transporter n=1 Tax=Burkholderia gladioli TaxID=28095 RepID=UPI00163E16F3|nr:hypothetical protein [Burkholderia gladioli]
MGDTASQVLKSPSQLDYLPVSLFGSVMGLVGLAVVWREAARLYGVPGAIADLVGFVAIVVFIALLLGYGWKCLSARAAVMTEFRHPVAGSLFGTVWISLLLLRTLKGLFSGELRTLSGS